MGNVDLCGLFSVRQASTREHADDKHGLRDTSGIGFGYD